MHHIIESAYLHPEHDITLQEALQISLCGFQDIITPIEGLSHFAARLAIISIEKAREIYSKNVNVRLEPNQMTPTDVDALLEMAKEHKGRCGLMFHLISDIGKKQRIYAHNVKVSARASFLKKLRDTYGKENIWVSD